LAISVMFAPSAAARLAISSPIPRLPPDMIIVRPFSGLPSVAVIACPPVVAAADPRADASGVAIRA
jgi:hypothetical protein